MKFLSPNIVRTHKVILAFLKELSFSFAIVFFIALCPTPAHAGLFSFISGVTSTPASADEATESEDYQTSQNIPILTPAANIDPSPILADDSPSISGDSLSAEVGPDGTAADVDQASTTQISLYVVRQNDSLSKIAQLFDVSVNTILWANDLTSKSIITEGQTLVILPMSGIQYTVKSGDTFQSIINHFNADPDEVLQYNDIASSSVVVGQTILIPDAELGTPEGLDVTNTNSTNSSNDMSQSTPRTTKGIPPRSEWGAPGTEPAEHTGGPLYPICEEITPGCVYLRPVDIDTPGYHKTQGLHGYNAVDLAVPIGTPIRAAADGTVIVSRMGGWNGGYGNYVVISHANGTQTLYAHVKKTLVSAGEHVNQGQTIALVGLTGMTTGPHVHFEIRGARNPF